MSDGDTRKVNEKVLKDPGAQWRPMEKFRSFQRSDQILGVHRAGDTHSDLKHRLRFWRQ